MRCRPAAMMAGKGQRGRQKEGSEGVRGIPKRRTLYLDPFLPFQAQKSTCQFLKPALNLFGNFVSRLDPLVQIK